MYPTLATVSFPSPNIRCRPTKLTHTSSPDRHRQLDYVSTTSLQTIDRAYYTIIARRKRSAGKATWPGRKAGLAQLWHDGRMTGDVLALLDDRQAGEPLLVPSCRWPASRRVAETRRYPAKGGAEPRRLPEAIAPAERATAAFPVTVAAGLRALAEQVDRRFAGATPRNDCRETVSPDIGRACNLATSALLDDLDRYSTISIVIRTTSMVVSCRPWLCTSSNSDLAVVGAQPDATVDTGRPRLRISLVPWMA